MSNLFGNKLTSKTKFLQSKTFLSENREIYDSDLDPLSEGDDALYVEDKLEVPDIFHDCEFQDDSEVYFYCEEEPSLDCGYNFSKRLASWAVQCKIPQ